jgi:Mg-chelatase subunit ChlD
MSPLLTFLLAAAAMPQGGPASTAQTVPKSSRWRGPSDALDRFRQWLARLRKGKETVESRPEEELRAMLGDLRTAWALDPAGATDVAGALLDFVGWCSPVASVAGPQSRAHEARELALDALKAHVDPEFVRWLTREVLAVRSQPIERRVAALAVLAQQPVAPLLLPLLSCAREEEPRIRIPALEMLVGWDDEGVHAVFLDELARGLENGKGAAWLAESHFGRVSLPPLSPYAARLTALVERGLCSSDWRDVSRAVSLSRPLDPESIIPFLIEALSKWKSRQEAGAQALRVEMEILRALENRSGRKFGPSPAEWSTWWNAVRRGDLKAGGPQTGRYREGTRPGFFGIHPATDRVTFVIDRSGSMDTVFQEKTGAPKRTRWEAAVEQLLGFVDAIGPRARFGVILFYDHPEEWRPTLMDATPENKTSARTWLVGTHPAGGTQLEGAIARAMHLGPEGLPDLAVLEADTVIVLCDGETAEGPGWVEPFLHAANAQARIVFHCVQIGTGGDGTLEKLAAGTGGDFVRVDG